MIFFFFLTLKPVATYACKMKAVHLLLLLIWALICSTVVCLGCLNNDGEPVNWWFVYQTPRESKSQQNGYLYFDSILSGEVDETELNADDLQKWTTHMPKALVKTLKQLNTEERMRSYDPNNQSSASSRSSSQSSTSKQDKIRWFFFNDQPKGETAVKNTIRASLAHSKV
jgi:hypothetical protein